MKPNMFKSSKILYLNNSGSRWIDVDAKYKKEKVAVYFPETNQEKLYTVAFIEAMGNFAVPSIKIKGKREILMSRYTYETLNALGYKQVLINNQANREYKYGCKGL